MRTLFNHTAGTILDIIGAAIAVHKDKVPGLLESVYQWCLTMELQLRGHVLQYQESVITRYKQCQRQMPLCFGLLIAGCLLVEGKAVEDLRPTHKAQLFSYRLQETARYSAGVDYQLPCFRANRRSIEVDHSRSELPVSRPS